MDKKHYLLGPFKDAKNYLQRLNITKYSKASAKRSKRNQAK